MQSFNQNIFLLVGDERMPRRASKNSNKNCIGVSFHAPVRSTKCLRPNLHFEQLETGLTAWQNIISHIN